MEKDPAQRFQTPTELLKAMSTITDAIDAGHTITHQSLQQTPLPLRAPELASRQQDWDRRKFQSPDCPLQEAMFLVERRISLFWMCMGKQGCKRRYNRCLGWCREVHAR